MKVEDRIRGCLYGIAVADALGAPFEGWRPRDIHARFGQIKDMMTFDNSDWSLGEPTDDTFLTLAGCRAYSEFNGEYMFTPEYAAEAMVAWMKNLGKGIGKLTNFALANISSGRTDIYGSGKKALASVGQNRGAGNGSLMRCAATGLVRGLDEMDKIIEESKIISEITHVDQRCIAACVGYNILLAGILEEKDTYDLLSIAIEETRNIDYGVSDIFGNHRDKIGRLFDINDMVGIGYVMRSLDYALSAIDPCCEDKEKTFEDIIVYAVSLGGDTDTNAAITGGLAGAMFGYDAIPQRWVNDLMYKSEIEPSYEMLIKFREGK